MGGATIFLSLCTLSSVCCLLSATPSPASCLDLERDDGHLLGSLRGVQVTSRSKPMASNSWILPFEHRGHRELEATERGGGRWKGDEAMEGWVYENIRGGLKGTVHINGMRQLGSMVKEVTLRGGAIVR